MIEIATLADIACAAGEKILEIYGTDFAVATKADLSPVTLADTAAEAIITSKLNKAFPGIPVVAEEAVSAGNVPETTARFFLVDPLDGSKEFIARNGEFTVNIALIDKGVPVAGVVYAPAIGRIWWGIDGTGSSSASVVDGNSTVARIVEPTPIAVRPAGIGLCAVGSRSHGSGEGDPRLSPFAINEFRSAGSSLKFCLLAEGGADIYPRFGRTMEWDTAAGDAILRAAGGRVTCVDGTPLRYGKRNQSGDSDFANPFFFAFGDPRLSDLIANPDQRAS
ncbi:MAG: 3'(2'),5'-bisphosphate nucleotidase CysQ [Alphaproteobacteria bacterium]|nr:3'(2'),5'-bisphosphate nucleotidase CysQ [Alphaproteobacteria bacterium]